MWVINLPHNWLFSVTHSPFYKGLFSKCIQSQRSYNMGKQSAAFIKQSLVIPSCMSLVQALPVIWWQRFAHVSQLLFCVVTRSHGIPMETTLPHMCRHGPLLSPSGNPAWEMPRNNHWSSYRQETAVKRPQEISSTEMQQRLAESWKLYFILI